MLPSSSFTAPTLTCLQHVLSIEVSKEGNPNAATVAAVYEPYMEKGEPDDTEGSVSIARKGLTFVAREQGGKVSDCILFFIFCFSSVFLYCFVLLNLAQFQLNFRLCLHRWPD